MFKITGGRGFHIQFDSGVTVSVQFGGGNYCQHHHGPIGAEKEEYQHESYDAEVAAWYGNGESSQWITGEYTGRGDDDQVLGWQSPADVLKLLNWAAAYKVRQEMPS